MATTIDQSPAAKKETAEGNDSGEFDARWDEISAKVQEYVHVTFHDLGAASRGETERLLAGLRYAKSSGKKKELVMWEEYVDGEMQNQLRSARALYGELIDPLLSELRGKTISDRVIKELQKKFSDEGVDYKAKEHYIRSVLPVRIKEWKLVKARRDTLAKNSRAKKITKEQVEDIDILFNEAQFAELKYPDRKGLVDAVDAALVAKDLNLEPLHARVKEQLKGYAEEGILHKSKVGTWMKRVFTDTATPDEINAFLSDTLEPYAGRWREAREEFDTLQKSMKDGNVPRGFKPLSLDQFLLKDYDARMAYLSEATLRLDLNLEGSSELVDLKLHIRYALDTEDWREAAEYLEKARALDPLDRDVLSMGEYLRTHGEETVETDESPTELNELLRSIVTSHAPGSLQSLSMRALEKGKDVFCRFAQMVYNRSWVQRHVPSVTSLTERQAAEDKRNHELTKQRMEEGHGKKLEHNVLGGDTAQEEAINDSPVKPQNIFMHDDGKDAVITKIEKNAQNEKFGYWTNLIPTDVPFELQDDFVTNWLYPLKSGIRKLEKMGYRFTLDGPVPVSAPKLPQPSRN